MNKIRGSDVNGNPVEIQLTQPNQLELFQTFLPSSAQNYSNSIELYDAIPKFVPSAKEMDSMRKEGIYLPILQRNFRHRDKSYTVRISPARIQNAQGIEKEFYPSHRDWMVEEALRKLASDGMNAVYMDNKAGVKFSLSELRRELAERGRSITYESLIESLTILTKTQIQISCTDGSTVLNSTIFPISLLPNRQQWLAKPSAKQCYVQFNPLVTVSIDEITYRQFNYKTFMQLRSSLSQWLHRRMSHVYTQASLTDPYTISLSTIVRDSGMVNNTRLADSAKQVRQAMSELVEKGVLLSFQEDAKRGQRRTLIDICFSLLPSSEFVSETKRANKRSGYLKGRDSDSPVKVPSLVQES